MVKESYLSELIKNYLTEHKDKITIRQLSIKLNKLNSYTWVKTHCKRLIADNSIKSETKFDGKFMAIYVWMD